MLEADQLVAERPDLVITVDRDADGKPIIVRAADFLELSKKEAANLREEGKLIAIAAQCLAGVI